MYTILREKFYFLSTYLTLAFAWFTGILKHVYFLLLLSHLMILM